MELWCELALALGGTIGELQERMTVAEVGVWVAYRQKHGPMTDARRYDRPAAVLGSILSHAYGGKAKPIDFMPWGKENSSDKEPTLDDIITAMGGVKIGKRG